MLTPTTPLDRGPSAGRDGRLLECRDDRFLGLPGIAHGAQLGARQDPLALRLHLGELVHWAEIGRRLELVRLDPLPVPRTVLGPRLRRPDEAGLQPRQPHPQRRPEPGDVTLRGDVDGHRHTRIPSSRPCGGSLVPNEPAPIESAITSAPRTHPVVPRAPLMIPHRRVLQLLLAAAVVAIGWSPARSQEAQPAAGEIVAHIPGESFQRPYLAVTAAEATGQVRFEIVPESPSRRLNIGHFFVPGDGHALLVVRPAAAPADVRIYRVAVREITAVDPAAWSFTAALTPAVAAQLRAGDHALLVRPPCTTRQLRDLPDVIPLPAAAPPPPDVAREAAARARSINNLKWIGLALHNFHSAHDRFPPAVIAGPDGRPWHSWRVPAAALPGAGRVVQPVPLRRALGRPEQHQAAGPDARGVPRPDPRRRPGPLHPLRRPGRQGDRLPALGCGPPRRPAARATPDRPGLGRRDRPARHK